MKPLLARGWMVATPFPLNLTARSMDRRAVAALQPGAAFTIHSVFERAINLRGADGKLLGVVGARGPNGPAVVVLRDLPEGATAALRSGGTGAVDHGGLLTIDDRWIVDLNGAELWQRPQLRLPTDPQRVRANLVWTADLARRECGPGGLRGLLDPLEALVRGDPDVQAPTSSPLLTMVWAALADLLPAWADGDSALVRRAAQQLVGLGPGQTPSGDDLLAGFMVAAERARTLSRGHLAGQGGEADGRASLRNALVEVARGRTTDLGYARLEYAAEGDLDERSELVLAALLSDDQPILEDAARQLLAFGHTSGLDTLVGLCLGVGYALRLLANPRCLKC